MPHRDHGQGPGIKPADFVMRVGRVLGPVLALAMYFVTGGPEGLGPEGRAVAIIGALMAVMWMTEALPLPITSLMPLLLFPLAGVLSFEEAAMPFADKYIFLFLGGFMIARAVERWNLHRRFALWIMLVVGTRPARLVGGFMLATAALSMWLSNTATAMMMLPMALSMVGLLTERSANDENDPASSEQADRFATCVLLGIAYSASIGGLGTLIGTPPNALLAGFLGERGVSIGFGIWMLLAMPMVIVLLIACWVLLTKVFYRVGTDEIVGGRELLRGELKTLGPMSRAEWTVLTIFVLTATMWILREPITHWPWLVERFPRVTQINDAMIAMFGAITLFAVPVNLKKGEFALDWETAKGVPWGILLLFGGGLSLAKAAGTSGFTQWVGQSVGGLSGMPTPVLVLAVALVVIFLTEVTSNTATAAAFLPIIYGVALGLGHNALMLLIPAVLAASCAFMLPVATPPNAIVYGSGRLTTAQMAKVGFWLNLLVVALSVPFMMFWANWLLGIR